MKNNTLRMTKGMRTALLVLLLNVVGMTKMYAYDFSAVCETGQTLYYNIIDADNHYVELTHPGEEDLNNCWTGFTKPTGNIILPENVQHNELTYFITSIGNFAFSTCDGLTGSLTIPNSLISIGDYAFYDCSGLTGDLTIPNSVTSIGEGVFRNCIGFTGSLAISNSITTIKYGAFMFCGFTGSLTIPNSVTSIGWGAFSYCLNFTGNLTISNSVTLIDERAFHNCSGFTGNLIIGNSVTSIDIYAFSGCSGFTSMSILAETPPSVGTNAFNNVNPDIPVTVPCGCIPVYEASDWHNYFTTILEDCTAISEDDENTITIYPNPTNGQVKIEAKDLKHITINNILGQVIYEGKANGNAFEYDFGMHGKGLYLVRIETASGVIVKNVSVSL